MVGFIVAMQSEFEALCGALGGEAAKELAGEVDRVKIMTEAGPVECRRSGIGKVNAAECATSFILESHPECIINSGLAGALDPDLKVGDIVVAKEVAYHDVWHGEGNAAGQVQEEPGRFSAGPALLRRAEAVLPAARFGLLCTGDQFFISEVEDCRILSLYPDALASDMESAAIAQVCRHHGTPFLCIRTISDIHSTPDRQKDSYAGSVDGLNARHLAFLKYFV